MNLPEEKKTRLIYGILMTLLLYIALNIFYAIAYTTVYNDTISYLITYALLLLICFKSYGKYIKKDAKSFIKTLAKHWKLIIISFTVFTGLMYLSNYCIFSIIHSTASQESSLRELIKTNGYGMIAIVGILSPIVEELISKMTFRRSKASKKTRFITYTIIFALLHLFAITEPIQLLYLISYTFMSLSFSYSYYKTNNIFIPILLHILNNLVTISIVLIGG